MKTTDFYKEPLAIYRCGSSVLLKRPNDIDLVFYYANEEDLKMGKATTPRDIGYCLHFDTASPKPYIHAYSYHFMEKIDGQDIDLNYDIFEHEEEYKAVLRTRASCMPKFWKKWYHILTAVYMYDNGSYDLTEEQLDNIQNVHDNGISEELYTYCIEKLK